MLYLRFTLRPLLSARFALGVSADTKRIIIDHNFRKYRCGIDGCKYVAKQKSNLLGHQRRKHKLSLETGGTVLAPTSSSAFSPGPLPAVASSSSPTYGGPSDGIAPEDYAMPCVGTAFAASGVEVEPSLGPHFPANMAGTPFLVPGPIPGLLVESFNLPGSRKVASKGESFTYPGSPPPRPPHPLRFLPDDVRLYAPVTRYTFPTTQCRYSIIPGEVVVPIIQDNFEPIEPRLDTDTALAPYTEADLYQVLGNVEDTSAGRYEGVWPGAGAA
ncbi:hypothetical protein BOTBODRAFT_44698 [Botryobasidium botryosum FD-172 SS1]|uniref:C2H2-type domain-containing protein n=1 Tax=Botryobasidium botryosum (strain FD-172 SS1) TaxID=930990 RepID=A0A067MR60_BOTB1|nr:hypothetical protein BOTBODRAFT_44698 [Botryobasidium botryosum FD-172 SS1]